MKKTFKKLFAALLAAALVLAMAVPAFAVTNTGTNGSITIDNAVDGETYTIYRMFKLDSYNGDAYSYTVEPAWETFFSTGAGKDYITLTNGHPTWNTDKDKTTYPEFAKAALAWAKANNISYTDKKSAAGTEVTFSGLDLGYYLVDSSLGALCSLDTTHPSATIKEKNGVPAMDKKIVTGENSTSDSSTAKIGDTVNYKVTIKVAKGSSGYELTDTMSDGLTFNSSSLKVTANGADATASSDYTLDSTEHGFKLVFKDSYIGNLAENAEITVTYNATLNEKAAVGDTGNGNTNSAALTYGNNKSVTNTTTIRTYEFDLLKVDGADHKLLNGAEFKLYDAENGGSVIKVVPVAGGYRVANGDETGAVDTIKVNGKVHISGLDKTTYWLEETKAPDGYNKLTERKPVNLTNGSNNTTLTSDTWSEADHGVAVENNAGAILPGTGGMGTTLFYVIGGGLMVAAVVLLITKKRMEHKN